MNKIEIIRKIDRVHPYPAKFPVDLALKYIEIYSSQGDVIYDPFLGSGTTLLASSILSRKGFGTDINHIAILISQFKLLSLSNDEFKDLELFICYFEKSYRNKINDVTPEYYKSIEHWFCNNSINVLSLIKKEIKVLPANEQLFCKTVMSTIINSVSNQESDTRYAAIEKPYLTADYVANTFIKKYNNILQLFKEFSKLPRNNKNNFAVLMDSKQCTDIIKKNSVDLVITSPPYVNTYDYYLYHKHRMLWLDFDVQYSMDREIGSRREYSSLKQPESKFNEDILNIFQKCNEVLKNNGVAVIVLGDGKISGKKYDAKDNMLKIAEEIGWELIEYSSTNLDDTSRAFQQSYRTKGKKEYVMTFRKKA